uniref:2-acylglycerol O-acyltransferase 1 n=1 Tax=Chelonoidis abingdonii TaxID=106734 RepID=A0A8C0GH95_CHEAB
IEFKSRESQPSALSTPSMMSPSQSALLRLLTVFIILLLGNYWFLPVLYALWLYLDWETPQTGGRRSKWVRNWTIWKYFTDYFPIHLIKTSDLDPSQNYLFGFHPHGILVAGAFGNFCTEYTGFKELFPGLTPYLHILPFWFGCPFFRDYALSTGVVSASKKSVSHVLNNDRGGNVAVIVIGGAEESLDAHPGSLSLNILKRRGFIKMALKYGIGMDLSALEKQSNPGTKGPPFHLKMPHKVGEGKAKHTDSFQASFINLYSSNINNLFNQKKSSKIEAKVYPPAPVVFKL